MSFLLGVSRKDITPALGGNLYGYHDKIFSDSINDRLYVTAVCFADNKQTVLLVSCDVCLIHNTLCDRLRKEIAENEQLPFENILIHAIHTHTGPNTAGEEGWGKIDIPYCESIFFPAVLEACHEACSNMQQAKMGYATADSRVGINRIPKFLWPLTKEKRNQMYKDLAERRDSMVSAAATESAD